MTRKSVVQFAEALLAMGGLFVVCAVTLDSDPAQAGQFYTRKRVNGVWMTGKFKRRGGAPEGIVKAKRIPTTIATSSPPETAAAPEAKVVNSPQNPEVSPEKSPEPGRAQADDYMIRLQRGLEARARAMTNAAPPLGARTVVNVNFDFVRRSKTTNYGDGTSIVEPLDLAATGAVAGMPLLQSSYTGSVIPLPVRNREAQP
jgi:hypothetical protein